MRAKKVKIFSLAKLNFGALCCHSWPTVRRFKNADSKRPKMCVLRSWLEQNADSGGSMNAKSHITTFKWRHINAFPVHLSSNNSLEQCAVHAHEIVFLLEGSMNSTPVKGVFGSAFWISVSKRWFCLRKISMNAALVMLRYPLYLYLLLFMSLLFVLRPSSSSSNCFSIWWWSTAFLLNALILSSNLL